MNKSEYNVIFDSGDNKISYCIPYSKDKAKNIFTEFTLSIGRFGLHLESGKFYKFYDTLFRTFKEFVENETIEDQKLKNKLDVYSGVQSNLNPRTIHLVKEKNFIGIFYEKEYTKEENELVVDLSKEDEDYYKYYERSFYHCSRGLKNSHTPYKPSYLNKWKYGSSSIKFSFKQENDKIYASLQNNLNNKPIYYDIISYFKNNYSAKPVLEISQQPDNISNPDNLY